VRDTLAHIWVSGMDLAGALSGRSPSSLPERDAIPGYGKLARALDELEMRSLGFVRGLAQVDLDRVFEYKTLKFGVYRNPLWESIAASRQSWHLSSRPGHHAAAATRRATDRDDLMHFYRGARTAAARSFGSRTLSVKSFHDCVMKEQARQARAENRIIGLVPTMARCIAAFGADRTGERECSTVIASIFVNPKQFGPTEDFSKYPRTFRERQRNVGASGN